MSPITVYVAGPITLGDQFANCGRAIRWGHELHVRGFVPYVPHWGALQQLYIPWSEAEWIAFDNVWLDRCEVLFRLLGVSRGADLEVARAKERSMPVFYENKDGLRLLEEYKRATHV